MICTCGAKLPIDNPSSICDACLRRGLVEDEEDFFGCNDIDDDDDCGDDCGDEGRQFGGNSSYLSDIDGRFE